MTCKFSDKLEVGCRGRRWFSLAKGLLVVSLFVLSSVFLTSCADYLGPKARTVEVPSPGKANERSAGINERPDSVMYLPLGDDLLLPEAVASSPLPSDVVGPFEMRGETLAGALKLIVSDYDIPIVFEDNEGLSKTITVTNLKGKMGSVVERVCGLANLYCAYEDGTLVVKESQTFAVSLPPVREDDEYLEDLQEALETITGNEAVVDTSTRTIIYTATSRTAKLAENYFQRLRKNTALITFEMYIWEVSLDSENETGIDWSSVESFGKFGVDISLPGTVTSSSPISIGLPTTGGDYSSKILDFISTYGAVKTISQPQITMLSGTDATLRVADTINYISSITRTDEDDGDVTTSAETDTVDTGFTIDVTSAWDNSTVYGTLDISLEEFKTFESFSTGSGNQLSLPETTERELTTQIRIRPGDSLLIAGLIKESDDVSKSGLGFMDVLFPMSRTLTNANSELVILIRPRVVVYTSGEQSDDFYPVWPEYKDYAPAYSVDPAAGDEMPSVRQVKEDGGDDYSDNMIGKLLSGSEDW